MNLLPACGRAKRNVFRENCRKNPVFPGIQNCLPTLPVSAARQASLRPMLENISKVVDGLKSALFTAMVPGKTCHPNPPRIFSSCRPTFGYLPSAVGFGLNSWN
jgi:hypothetical protein